MTEEKKRKIEENLDRAVARAEGRLSGANTNRDRASQNLGNYFAGTYIPQKANAYTQGVTDFNQRYSDYLGRTQTQKQYQSPDTFTRLEQQRQSAYENPNKQYAQMYARMQLEQGNNAPFQMMYGLNEAGEKQKQSISGLSDYYAQFGSQEGYNNAMEQQRLLNYDVEDAKRRLEQLKVNQPDRYGFNYDARGNQSNTTSAYSAWEEKVKALESEISLAEQTKQFFEDMKDPAKRAEYESYMQEQKSLEYRYSQMNPIEKIGHQIGQGVVGAGTQYFLKPAAFVSDLAGNVVGGGLKGAGETISYNSPFAPIGQGLRDVGQSVLNYTGKQTSDWQSYFDYLDRYAEYYKNGLRSDIGNEFVADAISIAKDSIIQILPTVAVAIASGGTSLGANAMLQASSSGNAVTQYTNIATKMIQNAAKNPSFWMSFGAEGGSAYLDALNNGADTIEATIAMLATGLPNALIEVGSGIEAIPNDKSVKGIRNWLKSIGKSAHEEGMEEIQQGIISQLVGQLVNDDLHLFSVDGQTGIIDPVRMVQEYYGGFVGGSVGGVKVGYINYKVSQAQNQFQDYKVATIKREGSLEKMKDIVEYASNSELTTLYNEIASNTAEASREECIKLYDMLMDAADGTATNIIETNLSDNYGVSESNAAEIAPIIQSLSYDNKLTIDQAEVLANNPEISKVLGTSNISADELVAISKNSTELQDVARVTALSRSEIDNFIAEQVRINERAKQAIDMIGLKNTTSAMGIKGIAPMAIERNGVTEEISIADSSAGRVLVRTPSGETFDAEDAPFATPETQTLVQLAGDYNTDTANTFVNAYPSNMDMGEYASLFADVYNLAKTSKYSLQGLYRLYAPLTSNPSVIKDAYNAAIHEIAESRRAYEEKQKSRLAKQKRSKGKLEISKEAQELVKKEHKTFADFIAKATKYTVRIIFDNEKKAQGTFDSTETEIVVNLAKGDFFSTMLHEVTHFIELNNVEGYNAFANEVMRYLSAKGILKETFDKYAVSYSSEIESIDELSSEVVANAAESLMKSEDFLKELFTDKDFIQHIEGTEAQSFVNKVIAKLKEILDSIKQFMADATLNHTVAEVFAEDTEQLNRMVKLWTDAFKGAAISGDVSADTDTDTETVTVYGESEDVGIPTVHQAEVQTSVKNSVAEYRDDNYKFIMPLGTSAPKLFTARAENGAIKNSFSGREIIELVAKQNYKKTGLNDEAVKQIIDQLDSIAKFMEEADVRFTAIGLADINNATAKVRLVKDANGVEIAEVYISAMVNNGDYPVNFDMTTVCKRREAAARVIKAIALKEGQKSSDGDAYNVDLSPQDLFRINEVLSAEGFETACLGCFVESKRYNMQNWAESFINKWNSVVAKYVKNADYFEFATQDTIDLANINTRAVDMAYNSSAKTMLQVKSDSNSKYSYEIEKDGKTETVEIDLLKEPLPDELWNKIEIAAGDNAKENGFVHIGIDKMKEFVTKYKVNENNERPPLSADDIKFLKKKKVIPDKQLSNIEKIEAFIEANPDLGKKLRISDLLTTDGIESIKRLSPALLGILSGHYGTATPKMMQGYTTYNSEIALLPSKKGKTDMDKYLKSVAGIRMNSFSDFKIETLLDYMQIIADMHIRGFTSHAYTKEIAFAEIFGKTGVKINVSIMFNVMNEAYWKQFPKVYQEAGFKSPEEAAKGLAGLYVNENGELDFLVADKSTRAKVNDLIKSTLGLTETDENGNVKEASWMPQQFVQSAEFEQAVELMHREGYSSNVGTIGVGYSKQHIIMMLNDSRFRYVIPYHSSSLPSVVKEASRLKLATDFTSVQNTLELSSVVENGEKRTFSKESTDGYKWMTNKITSFVEQGMSYAQAYQKLSDMMDSGEITLKFRKYQKAKNQHGTFDTYADLEATNNPKATCDNYLKYCADNGLMPMFYEFVGNDNYYKLNFDFNVYDNNSGEYAPQNPVGFAFPDNLEAIAEGYMEEANRTYKALATKMSGILDRLDAESKAKAESKKKTDTYSMLADAKFSLPESDTASYDILARENEDLKAQVKHLENEMKLTEGHKMKPEAVSKLARKLKKDYYSTLSAEEIASELTKIFEYIADAENASGDIAMRAMHSLAKRIVDSSQKLDTTLADEYKNVTEYLRKTKIRVSPGMESELAYLYGSYNNFRKSNFGRMSLSRDNGSAVDSVWQELNSLAPELFPEEVFPDTEMLPRIAEALDVIAPEYVNPYGQDADTFISGLASEIFDSYFDTPEVKTFADKQKAKLDKEIYKSRKRRAEQRARDKAKFEERLKKEREVSAGYRSKVETAEDIIKEYEAEYGSKTALPSMSLRLIALSDHVKNGHTKKAHNLSVKIATELYEKQNLGLMKEENIPDVAKKLIEDSKRIRKVKNTTIVEELKDSADLQKAQLESKLIYQRAKNQDTIKRLRLDRDEKLLSQKAKYQDMAKRKIEKRAATVLRHKIIKKALPLADRLIHPEKNKYVPLGLQKGVAEFLSTLDLDSHKLYKGNPTRFTEKLKSLYVELGEFKKTDDADMLTDTGHIESLILGLTDVTEGKSIYDLDVADLEEVYKLVTALDTFVRQSVSVTLEGKKLELEDTSLEVIREIAKARTEGKFKKLIEFGVTGKESSLNAYRILDGLGNYDDASVFHRIAVELRNREKVMMDLYNEGSEIFRELANDKKAMDKFFGDKAEWVDIGIKDSNGNPVKITHAMLVSIYLMSLDEGNRAHISTGGLTIPTDQKAYKKGEDVYKNAVTVRLTPEQLLAIASKMNDFDKKFAKAVQTFFDSFSKKYINETSVKILGYELAQIENYFPVISDEDFLGKNFEQMFNVTLSSYGSLKSRIKNATTPVQLMDVTSVVEKHLDFVTKYAAYAEIAQDLKRIYNYRRNLTNVSVQKAIGDKLGKAGNGFFENLIETVNDAKPKEFNFIDKLWSRATTATLAVNVSSTLKQFAAFPMAAATLGYEPLLKAMKHGVKKAPKELIRKYTGMLEYRLGSGNITAEMSSARMGKDLTKRMPMLMDWLNKMDGAIVGRLWYASEYYVDDNFKELKKGSDEYYTKVAEIFTDTVFETQANYTFMERAGIQSVRWLKPFTAFKTDAYQAFGLLYDRTARHRQAVREYKELLKNGGTEEQKKVAKAKVQATRKTMVTAYSAVILSNVTTTLAAVLATTILRKWDRVKDDKEEEVNFEGYLKYAISEFLGNLSGLITFGNQIADIISVLINKGKWYDIEDMGLAAINDFINSFINTVSGLLDFMSTDTSEMTDEQYQELVDKTLGKIGSLILSSSKGLGIPLGNALNIGGALKGWVGQFTGNDWDEDKEKSSKAKYNSIYNAYISGDTERYERLYDELIAEGTSDTTIKTQMKRRLYEQDSRVKEAAIASEEGRFVDYVGLVKDLVEDTGLSEGFVSDAVDYAIDKMNKKSTSNTATSDSTDAYGIMSGSVYGMNQLITATKDMNTANISKIYNSVYEEKLDYYLDEGYKKSEAEAKAKSSIKSSITSKIKPIVKDLYKTNKDKFAKLRTFLMKYLDYDSRTVNNWTNE